MHTYPDVRLFIGGEWRDALAAETIPVVDLAAEEVIGSVAHARHADLDLALEAADKGFTLWRQTSAFLQAFTFHSRRRHDPLLAAIASLRTLYTEGRRVLPDRVPVGHLACVTDAHTRHPHSQLWGDGTTASSDGQFSRASDRAARRGDVNLHYGSEPGTKFYSGLSDQ